jgi:hypothetical protein
MCGLDWSGLGYGPVTDCCGGRSEISGFVKDWDLLVGPHHGF